MSAIIDSLELVCERMQQEQADLKAVIKERMQINVTDADIEGNVDRLIYNHSLKKKELQELFGLSRVTFNSRIDEATSKKIIGQPIVQGRTHLYNRFDVANMMDYMNFPKYSQRFEPTVIVVENHKGGTGKSTTTVTLATAAALDLNLNARCLVIDLDPQGSTGQNLIHQTDEDSVYMTAIDIALSEFEPDGDFSQYLKEYSYTDLVKAIPFKTHLPNLDVIPAFPSDERFVDCYWGQDSDIQEKLVTVLKEKILPTLKEEYDLIFIDTPPQNSPILWSVNEAADAVLIPVTPREFDFASTSNYMATMPATFRELPSNGKNLKWAKLLPVNFDEKSAHEVKVFDKLLRSAQGHLLSTAIRHSEAFVAASENNRTVLDIKKSEQLCSGKQFDLAMTSITAVYHQFITEIKQLATKGL
ncbi:ParA family protein [Photobacterium damselae]|uniref:Chromosome (Plasmid) partitioning protein ParA n=4 Tax=Photobacterium damselae TaxID=38293 RepID=D0Z542_PHODD|nr:ParA family protein [Photobacterium damselae]EEZ39076.1 chromosome (plasmid) partitioning protein ParA [Photobacterium damselae subsp. damselae CIP 102761]KAB1174996.1 ParA family protein [Photobacterium damselae subsp. damselae]KAB1180246.1 ParA family protein [Photobacterium damselae subsp. damselae]MBF7100780.1 ParA family protein [Photobacterium damselae]NVO73642.1 ParA family protein [Photobacterium damselae subsp. damselae]